MAADFELPTSRMPSHEHGEPGLYSYGLHSYGLYSYGLYNHDLYSYGLYNYDLYSYGRQQAGCRATNMTSQALRGSSLSDAILGGWQ